MNYRKELTNPTISKFLWRKIFLFKTRPIFKRSRKEIWSRSDTLIRILHDREIKIYTGNKWKTRFVRWWMIGFKFGEFTWNKQRAIYKAKQKKKLKKKK
jgi:ribosomal protein S19